ncbi:helix-turn-helix domain-containing protein [Lacipirellula parvula]|uniref:Helix-turn-helix domain-containing protein n=1 Tax=Lacipirellula parvula TaxID=2650471 RepID=A0A5K7X945_9BACT|nr:helix-turn-helix domain-containing protein [Lacipirellula parvula]BBO33058.1 hypothetical protein PLANPX_2670 [Lacipirellula parvula]
MKKPEPEKPILLSRKETARLLGVSESHVKSLTKSGVLVAIHLGRTLRYRRDAIEAALKRLEGR